MKILLMVLSVIAVVLTSCIKNIVCIDGNGQYITEEREASEISKIVNTTPIDVVYRKADSVSVTISAESNYMRHIVTQFSGEKLEIRTDPENTCFDYRVRPVILITSPLVDAIDLTGSGSMEADTLSGTYVTVRNTGSGDLVAEYAGAGNIEVVVTGSGDATVEMAECNEADLTVTGSGRLEMAGEAGSAVMRITGSGDIRSLDLVVNTANESITGSGDIYTHVLDDLTAVISGSGNIYLRGNPAVNQTITGSGRVISY